MLVIEVPDTTTYVESTNQFLTIKGATLRLEHNLHAIHKWEQKWKKAYLSDVEKTNEELISYIQCMTLNENPPSEEVYYIIPKESMTKIAEYMKDPMSATTITYVDGHQPQGNSEIVTAEVIYYWMTTCGIPFEFAKEWHFNTLMKLIELINVKNSSDKNKMSTKDTLKANQAICERNKKYFQSRRNK